MLSLFAGSYKNLSAGQHLLLQPGLAGFITSSPSRLLREAKETLPAVTATKNRSYTDMRATEGSECTVAACPLELVLIKKVALSGTVVV